VQEVVNVLCNVAFLSSAGFVANLLQRYRDCWQFSADFVPNLLEGLLPTVYRFFFSKLLQVLLPILYRDTVTVASLLRVLFLIFYRGIVANR